MSKRRRCRNVVTVVNVLKEQGVLTIDIQEAFRRGNVDALIFSNKDAVLIKHSCGAYMLWAATVEAGRLALREVPEMQVCVVHGQAAFEAIRCERKGFSVEKPCKQFCRYSMQRHKAKSPFPIRELTTDDLPQVAAHYKLESKEEIAATIEHGRLALREVPEMQVCVVHGQAAFEAIRCERKGFSVEKPCKQFCRYSMQRHKAKSPFPIRELTTDDLPQVAAHYKLESKEEIAATIEHGLMFGAEVDGELAGFIGMHTDGSVGMLEVFKKYRRCGVGSALVSHMNNYHADRGWTVYGQVYFDNDVSLAMQRRLGLAESEDYIRWISGKDTF